MKNKAQKGGVLSGILWFITIIFVFAIGSQVVLALISQQTIKNAVKTVLVESKSNEASTPKTIINSIEKKLSVNNIDLNKNDIYVEKVGRLFVVDVNFQREISLTDNFKLLLNLSFVEESPQ